MKDRSNQHLLRIHVILAWRWGFYIFESRGICTEHCNCCNHPQSSTSQTSIVVWWETIRRQATGTQLYVTRGTISKDIPREEKRCWSFSQMAGWTQHLKKYVPILSRRKKQAPTTLQTIIHPISMLSLESLEQSSAIPKRMTVSKKNQEATCIQNIQKYSVLTILWKSEMSSWLSCAARPNMRRHAELNTLRWQQPV